MRAAEGAIEGVAIAGEELTLEVIGDAAPVGMCGSGLVDAVAQLVACGLLDQSGRYIPDEQAAELHPELAKRLVKVGEERVFVLAGAATIRPTRSTSRSATSASCSSPRPRSPPAGGS